MKKLQRPFSVFIKHLKENHNLTINYNVTLYEQEKDVFCFGYFVFEEKKGVFGQIDVHNKKIVYEISKYKRTQGEGFNAFSPYNKNFEEITY